MSRTLLSFGLILFINFIYSSNQSEIVISLDQGNVMGTKLFPDASKMAIYSYLGIPYAKPPVGYLRFALPEKHLGWGNRTFIARDFKPICPQIKKHVFDVPYPERVAESDEDCLFLNIWTPQSAKNRNSSMPVLMIITGEEQAFDWIQNRPTGIDLALEKMVVVSIQYRTNVFGFFTLRNADAPGNLALHDQRLAFHWITENIQKFGGDRNQITLLGHGSSGATSAMVHLSNTHSAKLFRRLILMSGTLYSTYAYNDQYNFDVDPSMVIVKKLACDSTHSIRILECLRQKSVTDLLKAFEYVYKYGNFSTLLGPQIDTYLPESMQYISINPKIRLEMGNYPDMPIMMGICSNEGAFIQELWLDLAREGYEPLKKYILNTLLPNIFVHYGLQIKSIDQIKRIIAWRFFNGNPETIHHLLSVIQRLISETKFESPFFETIERFHANRSIRSSYGTYVYAYHQTRTMDLRGIVNYFGGASHTSDLLYLMGPTLFQQISRRKLSLYELHLCKRIRHYFAEFIRTGNPTPGRLFDAWQSFTPKRKFVQLLGDLPSNNDLNARFTHSANNRLAFIMDWEKNVAEIDSLINGQVQIVSNALNPYQLNHENATTLRQNEPNRLSNYDSMRNEHNYIYYNELMKVHTFWTRLLPELEYSQSSNDLHSFKNHKNDISYAFASGIDSGKKFKHAFFSMLILMCLMIVLLGICIIMLRRTQAHTNSSIL